MIRTDRLCIYPALREQMEAMIASEQDEELKKAYTEMLEGSLQSMICQSLEADPNQNTPTMDSLDDVEFEED